MSLRGVWPGESEPILNLVGEHVALGPYCRDVLPTMVRWLNDFRVTRTLAIGQRPTTLEEEEDWYATATRSRDQVLFLIYERNSKRPIGSVGLHNIDMLHRTATFGILIGARDCWGRGYGTEATRLMLHYGFSALGLHNIWLHVYSNNPRAAKTYERAGFRVVGRRRECVRIGGELYDEILMDCLRGEETGSGDATILDQM